MTFCPDTQFQHYTICKDVRLCLFPFLSQHTHPVTSSVILYYTSISFSVSLMSLSLEVYNPIPNYTTETKTTPTATGVSLFVYTDRTWDKYSIKHEQFWLIVFLKQRGKLHFKYIYSYILLFVCIFIFILYVQFMAIIFLILFICPRTRVIYEWVGVITGSRYTEQVRENNRNS